MKAGRRNKKRQRMKGRRNKKGKKDRKEEGFREKVEKKSLLLALNRSS